MNKSTRSGTDSRKQAVSIRMSRSDVRHIKRLAERLGVRDSDVVRFAIKTMLTKLSPLQDPAVVGRSLVPVFVESGAELMRHFDLDASRLASILNDGVAEDRQVDSDDIQLIAMSGVQGTYLKLRIAGIRRHGAEAAAGRADGVRGHAGHKDTNSAINGHGEPDHGAPHAASDDQATDQSLRQYLYEKYLYPVAGEFNGHRTGGV